MRRACQGLAFLLLALAGPASADAATYCVKPESLCLDRKDTLQEALTAAQNTSADDTILLAGRRYDAGAATFTYDTATGGSVEVEGVGPATVLTAQQHDPVTPSTQVLSITGSDAVGSDVRKLAIE